MEVPKGLEMKLLLENWRQYLKEEDSLEPKIYSFDFDNTLIRYHTLEDGDVVYLGPHEENIQLAKDLAAEGNKVIIVTSRSKLKGPKRPWDDAPTPEEAIVEFGLPVEEVYYTFGEFKAPKLRQLGVIKHWDDDEEEVEVAEAAGIEAVLVPVEDDITSRLRDKWLTKLTPEELQEMRLQEGRQIGSREEMEIILWNNPQQRIKIEVGPSVPQKKKAFGGEEGIEVPFDYGEYPDFINPADGMGWDLILAPGATSEMEDLVPVGYVQYVPEFAEKRGNDKIIIAPGGHVNSAAASTITNFFDKLDQFLPVVWY